MDFEIELKAPCKGARAKVESLGAKFVKSESQHDTYFSHPCRDFKSTDEALRLRMSEGGIRVTYKGPKKKSDLKEREEIEFDVPQSAEALLSRLGFTKAFVIDKSRRTYELQGLTVCCDEVVGLGEYVEVEAQSEGDRERILAVLKKLGLDGAATTKSYSELLHL